MSASSIVLQKNPFQSRPERVFLKDELMDLKHSDQILFQKFGQGRLVPLSHSNIHHAFEEQVASRPDAVAAMHGDKQITYLELDLAATALAHRLLDLQVQPGDNVALFIQRSIPMLVGILATLKVGAAYVPQDAKVAPLTQLQHVMTATETKVVLTLSDLTPFLPSDSSVEILAVDSFLSSVFQKKAPSQQQQKRLIERQSLARSEDVCFVLFTSGTTGLPNGVQVTHKNLCNILLTEPGSLGMRQGLKVSQILNISFDMAAWEILGALSHGSTLLIREKDIQATVQAADIVIATPSILGALNADACRSVQTVAVAGEPCPKPLADQWSEFATFYNSCGPTEVTIVNTMQSYDPKTQRLTIGKPTPNNSVYILNELQKPCAIGEIGEMWAGGDCVSKGYLGNPQLTDERYRPDPFLGGQRKMFRTRDLGRWTANGELEHFGRTDDQVKVRGFRVELDSVSAALETTPQCLQAVTLKLDSRNLVSFLRPAQVNSSEALQIVKEKLPYYCTPSLILTMDEFPMTSRGKIDKRALTILAVQAQESL